MTEKIADLDKTLYELTEQYPELIDVLFDLGFAGVRTPAMREGHGKQMTVRAGCGHLGLDLGQVAAVLRSKGFTVKE